MFKYMFMVICLLSGIIFISTSCSDTKADNSKPDISGLDLKRGEIISCGPADKEFGFVEFAVSGSDNVKEEFNLAVTMLHSFEYDEAEKVFAKVIDKEPGLAMAYWGIAMANFHPLWTAPTEAELKKGSKAIGIAQALKNKTKREEEYIKAIAAYYSDWEKLDHRTRCLRFETAMEALAANNPGDKEASIFYALALNAAADPEDKTFQRQKKAASILNKLAEKNPDHPGIIHYIIHTYDYPELADLALPAARKYASIAPSSAHALHMPSHIFTRLGLWDESISSNHASGESARCYATSTGIKGHWDEEMHVIDYLTYAYLQQGNNRLAKDQVDYIKTINTVQPTNFKVAYSFASVPSRYVLENRLWSEAAKLSFHPADLDWKTYPWQKAIVHFTRLLGLVHSGSIAAARTELSELNSLYKQLLDLKDAYKAKQVEIQMKSGEAWIKYKEGKNEEAIALMTEAAELEDKTGKHPVTPGEVLPARELLADMYMDMQKWDKALEAYESDLARHANRFNALYGAGSAAEKTGDRKKAENYFDQLINIADSKSDRKELKIARQYQP